MGQMQTLPLPPLKLNSKNFELENTYLRICQCPCHLFTAIVSSLALLYNRYHKTQSLGNLIFSISNMPTFIINMLGFLTLESVHLVLNEHDPPRVWLMGLIVDCLATFGTMNTELLIIPDRSIFISCRPLSHICSTKGPHSRLDRRLVSP